MGLRQWVVPITIVAMAAIMNPSSAAIGVQDCSGPIPPTQSGRVTVTPGLNALKEPQHLALTISLFSCSPARPTRGAGTLKATIIIKAAQTCALLTNPHTLKPTTTTITWKANITSTLAITLSFSGATHNVGVTGTVTKGLFKNHALSGRFHYSELVSGHGGTPSNTELVKACKNKTAPDRNGRISINALTFDTTKPFIIN